MAAGASGECPSLVIAETRVSFSRCSRFNKRFECKLFAPKLAKCSQAIDLRRWLALRQTKADKLDRIWCLRRIQRDNICEKHGETDSTVISVWSHRSLAGIIFLFDKKTALFPLSISIIFTEAERDYVTLIWEIPLGVIFSSHNKLDASILNDRYVIVINVAHQGKIVSSAEFLFLSDAYL